jgi:hypothetical protein
MTNPMPAGWSLGQEKWNSVSPEIQTELCRMEREIAKGIRIHKARGAERQLELEAEFGNPKHGPSIQTTA